MIMMRYRPPQTPAGIAQEIARRQRTGRCVVCGAPADRPGVTCKAKLCISLWLGRPDKGSAEPSQD